MPDTIATHWSGGKVDGYSSKLYGMLSMVGIMIVLYIFLNVLPKINPKKANYEKFSKAFMMMNNGILLLLFVGNAERFFVISGIIMILSVFVPITWKAFVMVGIIIGAVGLMMGDSYVAYKKEIGA